MRKLIPAASIVVVVLCRAAPTQVLPISPTASPVFHGVMDIEPAGGTIDRHTGDATLKVHHWRFLPAPNSNGIFPDKEPLIVALGNNTFFLPAGSLARHGGKVFRYRAPGGASSHGIRSLRLSRRRDGSFGVAFALTDLALPALLVAKPVCVPTAVIVGDDDAASGVNLNSPSFTSRHLSLPAKPCNAGWPWLNK